MKKIKNTKKVMKKKTGRLPEDSFLQYVLAARSRKQVAQRVAVECKQLFKAEQAWIIMLPPAGNKPFILNAPAAVSAPAGLPAGLIEYIVERKTILLYLPDKIKPYTVYHEATHKLETPANPADLEALRQNDIPWLGKAYQRAKLLLISLDSPGKANRDMSQAAAKVLVVKLRDWKKEHLKTIDFFLPQARMALAILEQKKQVEKRLRQAAAVSEIAQNINSTMDLDILLRLIILEVTKAMRYQGGDIWLKGEKQTEMIYHSGLGLNKEFQRVLFTETYSYQVLAGGDPVWVEQIENDANVDKDRLTIVGIASLAIVPLKTKNKVIGVMHFYSKQKRAFSSEEQYLMKTLVTLAANAIDNARLFEETKRRSQELLALYEVAQVISEMSNLDIALEQIVERVSGVLNAEKSWFMFHSREDNTLATHPAAIGIDEEQIAGMRVSLEATVVSTQVFRTARPLFTNTAEQEPLVQAEFKNIFTLRNLMAVPLRGQEQTLGVFFVANKREQSSFTGNDVRLFKTLASEATVIIQNANLYNKLKRSYHSIVQVISDMVDAREPYTRGHSERVSSYSATIAEQMQLPRDEVERIKMAGLLHDIGKIGISENILLKPAKLGAKEYSAMQRHSEIGVQIIENVEFPWEIKDLILHHHEHFDGNGYPAGIKGEAIPLGSKIIAICDAFDVITSVRSYHAPKTPWDAFRIIRKAAGTQFDPQVTDAFEKVWVQLSEEIENRIKEENDKS
ncbi:GAF domain-containing protein [bacterium]|nr:GAF domain-containing protein [bacterium]